MATLPVQPVLAVDELVIRPWRRSDVDAVVSAFQDPEGVARSSGLHADGWHDMHVHARIAGDP